MTQYPELVSGEGRPDLAYMTAEAGDWVSKAGADGVQVLASRKHGIGIAVKVADGSAKALNTAMVGVLEALGMLDSHSRRLTQPLAATRDPQLQEARGGRTARGRKAFAQLADQVIFGPLLPRIS